MIRSFDVIFSLLSLIFFIPLFIIISLILKFTGEGDIFFFQKRVGKQNKYFYLIKFATMLRDSPNIGTETITLKNDDRILPVGKFLRKTKINELPQLLNILKGEMSIIGPRPLTKKAFSLYNYQTQSVIYKMRPGLSGIGSIIFRNEEDFFTNENISKGFYEDIVAPYKGELEQWYFINRSLRLYFKLILATAFLIFFPSSNLVFKVFKDIPKPPSELKDYLSFLDN